MADNTSSLILRTFLDNRIYAVEESKKKSFSYYVYTFRKLNRGNVTEKRTDKISDLLSAALGYRPQVTYDSVNNHLSVYIKRKDNKVLDYNGNVKKRGLKDFLVPVQIGETEDGDRVVLDLEELDSVLINGDRDWGRENLLSLIIREFRKRGSTELVLVDNEKSGIFDSFSSFDGVRIIRDEKEIIGEIRYTVCDRIMPNIFSDEDEKKNEKLYVFSGLDFTPENTKILLSCIQSFIYNFRRQGVYFVLSADHIPQPLLNKKFLEGMKCILSFKEDDEEISRALFKSADTLSLFYPDDALMRIPAYSGSARVQCYRL